MIPYVLFKMEDFTGTSLITLAIWGKIRYIKIGGKKGERREKRTNILCADLEPQLQQASLLAQVYSELFVRYFLSVFTIFSV